MNFNKITPSAEHGAFYPQWIFPEEVIMAADKLHQHCLKEGRHISSSKILTGQVHRARVALVEATGIGKKACGSVIEGKVPLVYVEDSVRSAARAFENVIATATAIHVEHARTMRARRGKGLLPPIDEITPRPSKSSYEAEQKVQLEGLEGSFEHPDTNDSYTHDCQTAVDILSQLQPLVSEMASFKAFSDE